MYCSANWLSGSNAKQLSNTLKHHPALLSPKSARVLPLILLEQRDANTAGLWNPSHMLYPLTLPTTGCNLKAKQNQIASRNLGLLVNTKWLYTVCFDKKVSSEEVQMKRCLLASALALLLHPHCTSLYNCLLESGLRPSCLFCTICSVQLLKNLPFISD